MSCPALRLVISLALSLVALPAEAASKPAYFISIDGLQGDLLRAMHAAGELKAPHGFGWLLDHSLSYDQAWPVITTMTAVSHISTITCSPPSRHGVIANSFLRHGVKTNGFNASFATEPLWRAAMRQGLKVLSVAYVGSGGEAPERSADYGLAYPDEALLAPPQSLNWDLSKLPAAKGWKLPAELSVAEPREAKVTLTLNPKTQETAALDVLVESKAPQRLWFARSKDLVSQRLGQMSFATHDPFDLILKEQNGTSRRTLFYATLHANEVELVITRPSYNKAYPESFRKSLDAAGLVWPDTKMPKGEPPVAVWLARQAVLDDFLATVAKRYAAALKVDLVLLYQPLIDEVGHAAQGSLPRPFHPKALDSVTQAFAEAFHRVDANLSAVLAEAQDDTPVALMGDHGMDAIKSSINAAALLTPEETAKVDTITSSGLLLLYAKKGDLASADAVGARLSQAFATTRGKEGQAVLAAALHKTAFAATPQADYRKEWPYGEARWAYMGSSGYSTAWQPGNKQVFIPPPTSGMHGTSLQVPSMATTLLLHGTGAAPAHRSETSLINAVPSFSKLLGITPPKDCLGSSLL